MVLRVVFGALVYLFIHSLIHLFIYYLLSFISDIHSPFLRDQKMTSM